MLASRGDAPVASADAAAPAGARGARSGTVDRLLRAVVVEHEDTETYVGFTCLDPDGHVVEVSWER